MKRESIVIHSLSVFGMIFMCCIVLIIGVLVGFMRNDSVTSSMQKANYYTETYEILKQSIRSMAEETGIPESVITDIIPENIFYITGRTYVVKTLEGKKDDLGIDQLNESLMNAIDLFYLKQRIQLNEEAIKEEKKVVQTICNIYEESIRLEFIEDIAHIKASYRTFILTVSISLLLGLAITIGLVFWLTPYCHRAFRQIAYMGMPAGILSIIISLLFYRKLNFDEIEPLYYIDFLQHYFDSGIRSMIVAATVVIVLSVLLWIVAYYIKCKKFK